MSAVIPITMSNEVEYVRTMNVNYGDKLSDTDFAKLASDLQGKGIVLTSMWSDADDINYGYLEMTKDSVEYVVVGNEQDIITCPTGAKANAIHEAFEQFFDDLTVHRREIETTFKRWVPVKGSYIYCQLELDGEQTEDYRKPIQYDDGLIMNIALNNSYNGLILEFTIAWCPPKVQREEVVYENLVETVLMDMARIQTVIEGRLSLKKYGYDIEQAIVDCQTHTKNESRTECSPEVIDRLQRAKDAI
jgi:hypothetical protein